MFCLKRRKPIDGTAIGSAMDIDSFPQLRPKKCMRPGLLPAFAGRFRSEQVHHPLRKSLFAQDDIQLAAGGETMHCACA
jgi:hypothetical protein